ncbi:MAG: hypothetical protein KAV87_60705, partial [Desulfobacteraceae bacterium]|nr:hypothetical protein [Desulfobacteraceae bacterium]
MYIPEFGLITSGETELDTQLGMVAPAGFAFRAVRHMTEFSTTPEQLAQVAVKNRNHARHNPFAQCRDPLTISEVLDSPMIVDSLTRFQCCPIADGASPALVCSSTLARRIERAVNVDAAILSTGSYENPQDLAHWETDYRGSCLAYEKAG